MLKCFTRLLFVEFYYFILLKSKTVRDDETVSIPVAKRNNILPQNWTHRLWSLLLFYPLAEQEGHSRVLVPTFWFSSFQCFQQTLNDKMMISHYQNE